MNRVGKPFKSYDELLIFLQTEKNLTIHDVTYAKRILTKTSYFSLISGYKDVFKNPTTGKYKDGTTFDDIYALYRFDNELRNIFLKYILIAEHSVKSSLAYNSDINSRSIIPYVRLFKSERSNSGL